MADVAFYNYVETTGLVTPNTNDLLQTVVTEYNNAFGTTLITTANTPQGVLIAGEVLARTRVLQLNSTVANQLNPNYAGGVFLDAILALTNATRNAALYTIVSVNVAGVNGTVIPAGSFVQDNNGNIFQTQTDVTITSATTSVLVQAVATGAITVAAGAITTIVSVVLGWETVVNPSIQAFVGSVTQSDAQARTLRSNTLALQGQSESQAITSGISAIPNVTSLFYQENDDSVFRTISNVLMKPNSLYACVAGGDLTSIANVLNQKKSGGCNYNNAIAYSGIGTTVGAFSSPASCTTTGPFTRATTVTASNPVILVTSTTGMFNGQTVTGTGIPSGSIIISFVVNTSFTINTSPTASGTPTLTFGGSAIVITSNTTNMFVGQTVSGTGIAVGSVINSIIVNTSFTMNLPATASGTVTLTMGNTPFIINIPGAISSPATCTTAGPFTISGAGTTANSATFTVSTTTGVFQGQSVTGIGIPLGSYVTGFSVNTAITINNSCTATGTITVSMGGSPLVTTSDTTGIFVGLAVSGTGVASNTTIIAVIPGSSFVMSNPATANGTSILTIGSNPAFYVGGAVTDVLGYVPAGSIVSSIVSASSIRISNLVTGSATEEITIYSGIPHDIQITDPFSNQLIHVLFDSPSLVPTAVQVTAKANSSVQNIISVIQNAVVDYANGLIPNDPGLAVGVSISAFAIAGAINIVAPSIFISDVGVSLFPVSNYNATNIAIQPFQQATITLSSVSVILI